MNKNDKKLIIFSLLISISLLLIINLKNNDNPKKACVYYENKLMLEIDLSTNENKIYTVNGYNGEVKMEVNNGKIQVLEEKSPLHLCSKQGYINKSYETIVCLPNKIVITIEDNNDYDTVVR